MNQTKLSWCVSIDGSKYSDFGWETVLNELYRQGDYIYIAHISNSDKVVPYENQPKTLFNKYELLCKGMYPPINYCLIFEERKKGTVHAMENLYEIAKEKGCSCIVMGFYGHKANVEKKELTKGITYMIRNISMPVMIIKERAVRAKKDTQGFNWIICISSNKYSRTYFNAFETTLQLVDFANDKLIGLTLTKPGDGSDQGEVEADFYSRCRSNGVQYANFVYLPVDKTFDSIGSQISNYVNYSEERIDFISLGYNYRKFENIEDAPAVNVIKLAMANILYCPTGQD